MQTVIEGIGLGPGVVKAAAMTMNEGGQALVAVECDTAKVLAVSIDGAFVKPGPEAFVNQGSYVAALVFNDSGGSVTAAVTLTWESESAPPQ